MSVNFEYKRTEFFERINIGLKAVLILNGCLACFYVSYMVGLYITRKSNYGAVGEYLTVYSPAFIYLFYGLIIYRTLRYKMSTEHLLGFSQPKLRANVELSLALACLIYAPKFFLGIFGKNLPLASDRIASFYLAQSYWVFVFHGLMGVLIAPLLEEIIFRGFFYPPIRRRFGVRPAIFLSSLIFAFWHLDRNIASTVNVFFFGLVTAYLFERTMSLISSIVFHSAINLSWRLAIASDLLYREGRIYINMRGYSLILTIIYLGLSMLFFALFRVDHGKNRQCVSQA